MRCVVQRVSEARVSVDGDAVAEIGAGMVALVGVTTSDGPTEVETLAHKLTGLRIFSDDLGRMNRSIVDVSGSILVVSQFTLYGSVVKGRRPSFDAAAAGSVAEPLIDALVDRLAEEVTVASGRFGAMMEVSLTNDGPVTLVIDVTGGKVVKL